MSGLLPIAMLEGMGTTLELFALTLLFFSSSGALWWPLLHEQMDAPAVFIPDFRRPKMVWVVCHVPPYQAHCGLYRMGHPGDAPDAPADDYLLWPRLI